MTDIILYISIIVVSGIVGSKVRAYRDRLGWTGTVQTMAIVLLVVLMGARMGANEEIIDNLGTIGLAAFAMTIAMMIGSLLCLFFARKALGFTKDAKIAALHCDALTEAAMEEEAEVEAEKHGINKMTLIILCSVIIGMALGYLAARPLFGENIAVFDHAASLGIKIGLCILMVFVGLDLGLEGTVLTMMREAGLRILVFPICLHHRYVDRIGSLWSFIQTEPAGIFGDRRGLWLVFAGAGHHHGSRLFNRERDLLFT